jgi:type 1 glutamine amidotransferase
MRSLRLIVVIVICFLSLNHPICPANVPLIRVLILSGQNNHDWQKTTPLLSQTLQQTGRFSVSTLNDPNQIDDSMMQYFDVIVINWSAWPALKGARCNMVTEAAIADFIQKKGKGLVVFHGASATHQDWPEYQKMVGATWDQEKSGNSAIYSFKVAVKNKEHPITKDMPDFWTTDELLHKLRLQPNVQILCTANSAKNQKGTGKDEPVVICTSFGAGRCFYNVLGHDTTAMQNVAWSTLMLRGIEWAATGQVTIPIPQNWPEWQEESEKPE